MAVSETPPLSRWLGGLEEKGWRIVTDERHTSPSHGPMDPGGFDHKVVVCPLCGRCETCDDHAEGCRIGQLEAENAELKSMVETLKREIDIGVETIGKLKARADEAEELLDRIAYAEHHTPQVNEWLRTRRTGGE